MKTFYSAEDIQNFADQGQREISIDDRVVLTDMARQTAHMLGIRITEKQSNASSGPAAPPRPDSVGKTRASGAKPRGCQRRPAIKSTAASGPSSGNSRQVVDQLVETIKRIKDQNVS
jgi:hypothetical protein